MSPKHRFSLELSSPQEVWMFFPKGEHTLGFRFAYYSTAETL